MSTEAFVPAIPGGRPAMPPLEAELTDTWLVPNGIVGLIPSGSTITVTGGQVTWPEWRHRGPDPWSVDDVLVAMDLWPPGHGDDAEAGGEPVTNVRTGPLKVPVTDHVRHLFQVTDGRTLVER